MDPQPELATDCKPPAAVIEPNVQMAQVLRDGGDAFPLADLLKQFGQTLASLLDLLLR